MYKGQVKKLELLSQKFFTSLFYPSRHLCWLISTSSCLSNKNDNVLDGRIRLVDHWNVKSCDHTQLSVWFRLENKIPPLHTFGNWLMIYCWHVRYILWCHSEHRMITSSSLNAASGQCKILRNLFLQYYVCENGQCGALKVSSKTH